MSIYLRNVTPYVAKNSRGTVHIVTMRGTRGEWEKTKCGLRSDSLTKVSDAVEEYDGSICGSCERSYSVDE